MRVAAPAHEERADAVERTSRMQWRRQMAVLGGLSVFFVLVQLFVVQLNTLHLGWDEVIHMSQVVPGEPARGMAPHRTRGISLVAAPVAWAIGHSTVLLRLWFAVVSALGTFLAFRSWTRLLGWAAPVGAGLLTTYWVSVFFASGVFPNYLVAVAGIGAVGHLLLYWQQPVQRRDLVITAALVAAIALLRPPDAVLIAAGAWLGTLLFRRVAVPVVTLALGAAGLVGLAPWFIEGWVRFGLHPLALVSAAQTVGVGVVQSPMPIMYLNRLEQDARCALACKQEFLADPRIAPPLRGLAVLIAQTVLAVIGVVRAETKVRRTALLTAALCCGTVLAYYLTCACAANHRYLLPAYAFAMLLVGAGLIHAARLLQARVPGAVLPVAIVLGLLWGGYQVSLVRAEVGRDEWRAAGPAMAQLVQERAQGRSCSVGSTDLAAQVQFYSSCRADGLSLFVENLEGEAAGNEVLMALVRPGRPRQQRPFEGWDRESVQVPGIGRMVLFSRLGEG